MPIPDQRPWLDRYDGVPPDFDLEHSSALAMFRAGCAAAPDSVAIQYFDGATTRAELDAQSDALAVALREFGFGSGDRLAVYLQNVPQFLICMLAAWKTGGLLVSINPMSRARELGYLLSDSGAKVLVCLEHLFDEVARDVVPGTSVEVVLTTSELEFQSRNDPRLFANVTRQRHDLTRDLMEAIAEYRGQTPPPVELHLDDIAFLTYTSGTTGVPKGAMNTHRNVVFTAMVDRDFLRFQPGGSVFGLAPLFHITGLIGHIAVSFLAAMPLISAYRFEPGVVSTLSLSTTRPTPLARLRLSTPCCCTRTSGVTTSVRSLPSTPAALPSPPQRRRHSWPRPANRCTTATGSPKRPRP